MYGEFENDELSEDETIARKKEQVTKEMRLQAEIDHEVNRAEEMSGPVKTYFIKSNEKQGGSYGSIQLS